MIRLNVSLIRDENVLNNLFEKNIYTVNDFLQKKTSNLQSICKLQCKEITKLKDCMTVKCSSPLVNGYELYLNRTVSSFIQTGIIKLDNILDGGLFAGNIYELCGPSACGKTQICFSILLNLIISTKKDIVYIDTKNKFSVNRIKQMLKNKCKTNNEIKDILNKIHVYSILNIYNLITCLHCLKEKSEPIIIIDSLPALYLSFIGFDKNDGLSYINHICSVLKYLCNKNATIMVTNLAVKNCDFTNNFKPAIGKYWFHIPNTRLMITPIINQQHQQQICINITKSVYIPLNEKLILNIDDFGVS
ncbi:DNA repair protein RAD51 homolog 4 [Melanaphis sacchari]|uniref:DNA repair protein RAD51 homolog 4 n=1 Tax=Melanaphis sacchari TaxID=742174 RepID=UPI000DC13433|nr:DNA repair protein RAD51 homolog 4 [Melanaphis sacchari]XP_025194833.1 DNA repair protein RAD51 homolog 4 [Melanaphis sacchari]